jgi:hypothetical protein
MEAMVAWEEVECVVEEVLETVLAFLLGVDDEKFVFYHLELVFKLLRVLRESFHFLLQFLDFFIVVLE